MVREIGREGEGGKEAGRKSDGRSDAGGSLITLSTRPLRVLFAIVRIKKITL